MIQPSYLKLNDLCAEKIAQFAQSSAATVKDLQQVLSSALNDARNPNKGIGQAISTLRLLVEKGLHEGLRETAARTNGVPMRMRSVLADNGQQLRSESPSLVAFYNLKNATPRQGLYTRLVSDFIAEPDSAQKKQLLDTMVQLAQQADQSPVEKGNAETASKYMAYWLAEPSAFPIRHPIHTEGMDLTRAMALLERMPDNQLRLEDDPNNALQATQMVGGLHRQHAQRLAAIDSSKDRLATFLADESGPRTLLSTIGRDVHAALLQIKIHIQEDRAGAHLLNTSGLSEKHLTRALVEKDILSKESLWDRVFNPLSTAQLTLKVTEVINKVAMEALVSAHTAQVIRKLATEAASNQASNQDTVYERQRG